MLVNLTSNIRNSKAGEDVVCINTYTTRVCVVIASIFDTNVPLCFFKVKLAALACCDASFVFSIQLAEKYNSQLLLRTFSCGCFVLDGISKYCNFVNHHSKFIDVKLIAKVVYVLTIENNRGSLKITLKDVVNVQIINIFFIFYK